MAAADLYLRQEEELQAWFSWAGPALSDMVLVGNGLLCI